MASYTIATETALTDERLRQIYNTVKAGIIHFPTMNSTQFLKLP